MSSACKNNYWYEVFVLTVVFVKHGEFYIQSSEFNLVLFYASS